MDVMKDYDNAVDALNLLGTVPGHLWIVDEFTNYDGSCCAVGHYERLTSGIPQDYSYDNCSDYAAGVLRSLAVRWTGFDIASVNNGNVSSYFHLKTPKQRTIAFLKDLIQIIAHELVDRELVKDLVNTQLVEKEHKEARDGSERFCLVS